MPPLHHRLEGRTGAPPVVLSGALASTLQQWDPQVSSLAERFTVLRYDRRGHGGSPVPPGPYTIEQLGTDVLELLDLLELTRVSFCGLSLGGAEGMWLAAHAPERVDRLVLACTAPQLPPREMWEERAAAVRAEGTAVVADATMERWFTPGFRSREPETVARVHRTVADTPAEGYAACCDLLATLDLTDELSSIGAPALVVNGELDPTVPPEVGAELTAAIRAAEQVVIAGAQHLVNVEQPTAFTRAILRHLAV